jgi:hypothetical protein
LSGSILCPLREYEISENKIQIRAIEVLFSIHVYKGRSPRPKSNKIIISILQSTPILPHLFFQSSKQLSSSFTSTLQILLLVNTHLQNHLENFITMKFTMFSASRLAVLALVTAQFSPLSLAAPTVEKRVLPVVLGAANTFAALAATTLTSSGATVLTGNGGVWPGTAIVGFPPGRATGVLAAGTVLAENGQAACLVAYNKYVHSLSIMCYLIQASNH